MADWNHETYCRLYKRTDSKWARLPLFVRALGTELLRHVDDDGCIYGAPGEEAWEAVARIAQAHPLERDAVRTAVALLTADNGPSDPPFMVLTVTGVVTEDVTETVTPSRSERDAPRDGKRDAYASVTLTVRNYRAAQGIAESPEERRESRSKEAARAAAYRKRKRDERNGERDDRRDAERDASASHVGARPRPRVAARAPGDAPASLPFLPSVPKVAAAVTRHAADLGRDDDGDGGGSPDQATDPTGATPQEPTASPLGATQDASAASQAPSGRSKAPFVREPAFVEAALAAASLLRVDPQDVPAWACGLREELSTVMPAGVSAVPYLAEALRKLLDLATGQPEMPSRNRLAFVRKATLGLVHDDKRNGWASGKTEGAEGVCAPRSRHDRGGSRSWSDSGGASDATGGIDVAHELEQARIADRESQARVDELEAWKAERRAALLAKAGGAR